LENYVNEFQELTYSEIKTKFSPIITGREDVIISGTMILLHLVNLFGKDELSVSGRGLRYGAIIS